MKFKLIDNKLHYKYLEVYNGESFDGCNSDGDDMYSSVVKIKGWTDWAEVPMPEPPEQIKLNITDPKGWIDKKRRMIMFFEQSIADFQAEHGTIEIKDYSHLMKPEEKDDK